MILHIHSFASFGARIGTGAFSVIEGIYPKTHDTLYEGLARFNLLWIWNYKHWNICLRGSQGKTFSGTSSWMQILSIGMPSPETPSAITNAITWDVSSECHLMRRTLIPRNVLNFPLMLQQSLVKQVFAMITSTVENHLTLLSPRKPKCHNLAFNEWAKSWVERNQLVEEEQNWEVKK